MTKMPLNPRRTATLLAMALLAAHAWAAQPTPATTASDTTAYQRERAACMKDDAPQGRATCLKEAEAAHAEARRGRLDNGEDAAALNRNAELRCKQVAAADRDTCMRMARGEGTVSGSVAGGGVMRTLVTTGVAPAAMPPMPAASR